MRLLPGLMEFGALALVPLAVIAGYALFGGAAAASIRIVDFDDDFLTGLAVALALLPLTQLPVFPKAHRPVLALLWLMRIGVTLGVMLPYEAYYGLDAARYYQEGLRLSDPLAILVYGNGTRNIEAATALLLGLVASYSAVKVIFAFVGLLAVYVFYRAGTRFLGRDRPILLLVLGAFPSILFWNSILGKDPVTSLGIAVFALGAVGALTRRRIGDLVLIGLGLGLASGIRSWLSLIFLAPLVATIFLTGRTSLATKLGFSAVAVPGFLLSLQLFQERFRIQTASDLVQRTDTLAQSWARGGSAQGLGEGFGSLTDMILFLPVGAFTALFRPLPGEVLNPFGLLAGLENAALLGLILYGLRVGGVRPILREPVLLWAVLTLLAWSAVYGFVSYQNLGTAFRFRVQVAPIMLLLALYLAFGSARARTAAPP